MTTRTTIEWTDVSWNPIRGCAMVSAGCTNCYAMKQAHRFSGPGQAYAGLTKLGPHGPQWRGTIRLFPGMLEDPLHWKTPRRVFVNSMSDLFHDVVPDEFIDQVFITMGEASQHTFQILTKRPQRMQAYLDKSAVAGESFPRWPLPNVWLGVSVEDQASADERIPLLLGTPAAVRWISAEPLLGPVNLDGHLWMYDEEAAPRVRGRLHPSLDWVVVGGESGPRARPCDLAWIRSIKDQCQAATVPVFIKQLGAQPYDSVAAWKMVDRVYTPTATHAWHLAGLTLKDKKGGDMAEFPKDLRVREFPR
jgi:protein gp37